MPFFTRLSLIGVTNSILCTITLIVVIICNIHVLYQLDSCSHNVPQETMHNSIVSGDVSDWNAKTKRIYQYFNNANFNMYLSSLSAQPTINPSDPNHHPTPTDCIVFLSDPNIINSTLGAIYNMREPTLGNWSQCIIVLGNNLVGPRFKYMYRYFKCLNVYHLDITNDPLKKEFPHVHYWKTYIMLHPFFRDNKLFRYIMYLDSDCITIKPIGGLIERTVAYVSDKYGDASKHIWAYWREDYRHKSMYKAVLDLKKYDPETLKELNREYPDYVESKQGNVMILYMMRLPSVGWFKSEITRIMDKYSDGFWRNDQSLFNLMFYHNSSDLGWSAFTHPPSEQWRYEGRKNKEVGLKELVIYIYISIIDVLGPIRVSWMRTYCLLYMFS
eukprot:11951_1